MEEDLRTWAAPPRTFTNPDNMVEMIRRGNGLRDLASKQAFEHAIMTGRGNVDLFLTQKQYGDPSENGKNSTFSEFQPIESTSCRTAECTR
jgi:hypothetical protein